MKHLKFSERGQALILIAFGLVGLLGMTALAVDGGTAYTDRRHAQTAADTSALAAAVSYVNGDTDWQDAANINANKYGYNDNGGNDVTVNNPPQGDFCDSLSEEDDCNEYIQVIVESHVPTTFGQVVQIDEVVNKVEAIARAVPVVEGSETESSFFDGYALVSMDPTGSSAIDFNGNITTSANGGGVYARSNHDRAFTGNGNLTINSDVGIATVGGARLTGNVTVNTDIITGRNLSTSGNIDLNGTVTQNATVPVMPDPPVYSPPQVTAPTCSGTGTMSTVGSVVTLTPGNHPARSIAGNFNVLMQPGNYCFSGNYSINGNYSVTADNVAISMLTNKSITLNGNLNFNAANSFIYLNSGTFNINGNAHVNISNTPIYMVSGDFTINGNQNPQINSTEPSVFYMGSGKMTFNGNSTFTSTNTMFYLNSGSLKWNGNNRLNMSAPTSGPFEGLLLYMPPSNTSGLTINGNSSAHTTGTILAPGSTITINGNSGTTALDSQIVAWRIKIAGNANTTINFDEGQNFTETQITPAINGRIELIK